MAVSCPRCQYDVAEGFVFCPRCARLIWPHLKTDLPRRLKSMLRTLGIPLAVGGLVGAAFGQSPITALMGLCAGLMVGLFLVAARCVFGAGD